MKTQTLCGHPLFGTQFFNSDIVQKLFNVFFDIIEADQSIQFSHYLVEALCNFLLILVGNGLVDIIKCNST